jgi:ubiquinone/menaquinone biosynthesis C-methylase UbiE
MPNDVVRQYWEKEPCGTSSSLVGAAAVGTREWFEAIEERRYDLEPFIHSVAQFTRHHGKTVLEVGVGAGTDHLQWARAGAECYGVDLTDAAIETTRSRLEVYGFDSTLQRIDAERLPFPDDTFDVTYSWGVIHHSQYPERIIREIRRVLRPGGVFIGMMYGRRSVQAFKLWVRHALLSARPWRSLKDVVWNHVESIGTKAYTVPELRAMFREFGVFEATPIITPYDRRRLPEWLGSVLPARLGWFIALRATK